MKQDNIQEQDNMTEQEIRRIAREESLEVFEKSIAKINNELLEVKNFSKSTQKTLERLERLLLGEMGVEKEDTLKARATFAYNYARRCEELRVLDRTMPVIEWFEDWDTAEKGYDDSRLEVLSKLITTYDRIKWLLALLGITTLINALPAIQMIVEFVKGLI